MDEELQKFPDLKIPLEEITSATNNFDGEKFIGIGGFGKVYKGELSHSKGRSVVAIKRLDRNKDQDQGDREFLKEITTLSQYKHQNLISLLGFCYQGGEAILVYELASHGSLDRHLGSSELTWSKRIKICLDAAKGLRYLHDPRGTHQRLIHCDVKSGNILLDDHWNAKVADFGFSTMGPANELQSAVINLAAGTLGYCEPKYAMTHTLTKESDVYSFGVVLFEVLCGRLCYTHNDGRVQKILVSTWTEKYEQKKLDDIIFKHPTPDQTMDERALATFSDIAFQCLEKRREDRPKMAEVVTKLAAALRYQEAYDSLVHIKPLQEYRGLNIQLKEIISATNNFDDLNCIGEGDSGKVYKGELFHSDGRSMVAIKRLHLERRKGLAEFYKEIHILSSYRHENLISLLGFCNQGDEYILVYEHASRGSLGDHLKSPHLTWSQRLKICLDIAKVLSHLHDIRWTHNMLIHCNTINTYNILLDDQWNAKVTNIGLKILTGPANAMTYTRTEESNVYSFGVVLFEVLCGTLHYTYTNGSVENLEPTWIKSYEEKKLNDIIFKHPTIQPLHESALETFSHIAYQCLKGYREDRPKIADVVTELETALANHILGERKPLFDYEETTKSAEPPLNYRSKVELWKLLCKGVLLNCGKTWFSLNTKGEHCETISFSECLDSAPSEFQSSVWSTDYNSRFAVGTYRSKTGIFNTRVKTQFLSPGITYTVNLAFKMYLKTGRKYNDLISLKYKLYGETKTSISYIAYEREDGWRTCELYQLTSDHRTVDLKILFEGFDQYSCAFIEVEGIEFRPLEKVDEMLNTQPISDSDANWEKKLPTEYEDIMKWSKSSLKWTTKREAYSSICKGFLIDEGDKWFSLDKNGKKCHILSARAACMEGRMYTHLVSLHKTRFGEALEFSLWRLVTSSTIESHLVSPQTTYASYLVYKLPKDQSGFEAPVKVKDLGSDRIWYIYLVSPQTPVIRTKAKHKAYSSFSRPKIKGLPQYRNDGWMEVQIWEFQTATTTEMNNMRLKLSGCGDTIPSGLIVQGVDFRPA